MFINKDILLIDFETTDIDMPNLEPIEVGVILMASEDLHEIARYHSYIIADHPETAIQEALNVSGRTKKSIATEGKTVSQVVMDLEKLFKDCKLKHRDVYLCSWNSKFDVPILLNMYKKVGFDIQNNNPFDYHAIELWTLMLGYQIAIGEGNRGMKGIKAALESFNLQTDIREYGHKHDAIEDCEQEAEILRAFFHFFEVPELVD